MLVFKFFFFFCRTFIPNFHFKRVPPRQLRQLRRTGAGSNCSRRSARRTTADRNNQMNVRPITDWLPSATDKDKNSIISLTAHISCYFASLHNDTETGKRSPELEKRWEKVSRENTCCRRSQCRVNSSERPSRSLFVPYYSCRAMVSWVIGRCRTGV